jgi:DNA-binding NarL/FixJ family response regulator
LHKTLLIVDHTDFMRFLLGDLANEAGIRILAGAGTRVEALKLCGSLQPELAAVDLCDDELGAGIIAELRSIAPRVAVAAIVPAGVRAYQQAALAAGADVILEKPYDPEQVRFTLEALQKERQPA